jgi:hypothetical protein
MRALIVLELALHVDATDGIVDAMLNVSAVRHDASPEWFGIPIRKTSMLAGCSNWFRPWLTILPAVAPTGCLPESHSTGLDLASDKRVRE